MQQRLMGLVVNDAALMPTFSEHYADYLALATDGPVRGVWGLGFHGHGEMLVKKNPVTARENVSAALQNVRARHVVVAADIDPPSRQSLEDAQPIRYRDWLFAASGTASLRGGEFVRAVQDSIPDSAFAHKRGATAEEALCNHFMEVLHRAGVRDSRKLTTASLRAAIGLASRSARELIGDAQVAVILHCQQHLFAVSLGRPIFAAVLRGLPPTGERRGGRATVRLTESRGATHMRGVIVRDWEDAPIAAPTPSDGPGAVAKVWRGPEEVVESVWKTVESAIEVGADEVMAFSLN